jgi:hypothetical protein
VTVAGQTFRFSDGHCESDATTVAADFGTLIIDDVGQHLQTQYAHLTVNVGGLDAQGQSHPAPADGTYPITGLVAALEGHDYPTQFNVGRATLSRGRTMGQFVATLDDSPGRNRPKRITGSFAC